jgi:hypothetical protein
MSKQTLLGSHENESAGVGVMWRCNTAVTRVFHGPDLENTN